MITEMRHGFLWSLKILNEIKITKLGFPVSSSNEVRIWT